MTGGDYKLRILVAEFAGKYTQQLVFYAVIRVGGGIRFLVSALLEYGRSGPVGDTAAVLKAGVVHISGAKQTLDDKRLGVAGYTHGICCCVTCDDAPYAVTPRVIIYIARGTVQVVDQYPVHFLRLQHTGSIARAGTAQCLCDAAFAQLSKRDKFCPGIFFLNASATDAQAGSAMVD